LSGNQAIAGLAVLTILIAMACGWLFRRLLLRALQQRHPDEFEGLGHPDSRQLASLAPRYKELQIRFWKYLWEGKVFRLGDRHVSRLAWAALIADAVLAVGVVALLWYAATTHATA
jgi:hypothetical protein